MQPYNIFFLLTELFYSVIWRKLTLGCCNILFSFFFFSSSWTRGNVVEEFKSPSPLLLWRCHGWRCWVVLKVLIFAWNKLEQLVNFFVDHQIPFINNQVFASYDCIVKACGLCSRIWIIIGSLYWGKNSYYINNPWNFITFWLKSVMFLCVLSWLIFYLMKEKYCS